MVSCQLEYTSGQKKGGFGRTPRTPPGYGCDEDHQVNVLTRAQCVEEVKLDVCEEDVVVGDLWCTVDSDEKSVGQTEEVVVVEGAQDV